VSAVAASAREAEGAMTAARSRLITELRRAGFADEKVLAALARVPRHRFVDETWRSQAYVNRPLPIGEGQTISQPQVVALMTALLLEGGPRRKVLEVGTGCGYQTAVLAELVDAVFSVERIKSLSMSARQRLRTLGYRNVHCGYSDGALGWPAHQPFDGIVVTAAGAEVPRALLDQLQRRGRLVMPLGGEGGQRLTVIDRGPQGWERREIAAVNFVPLLGGRV
jgi:protein-L-isoaspartate(D-aspartate) O-methyltransferase